MSQSSFPLINSLTGLQKSLGSVEMTRPASTPNLAVPMFYALAAV